ncbi:MAG TPA: hypothetical protein VGE34_01665 [Candidatus Saccharimonadales bacterium]
MAKKKQTVQKKSKANHTKRLHERLFESDSTYFLKLVVVFLMGTLWLKFHVPFSWMGVTFTALPLGLLIGLLVVRAFEHHQEDRKIWYAVLLFVSVVSLFGPAGIVI